MRKNMTFFKHCRRAGRFSTFLARSIFFPPKSRPKRKINFLVANFFSGDWDAGTAQAWNMEFEPGQTRSAMIFEFADRFAIWATPAIISEAGRQASASLRRCSMLFLPTDVKQENIP